ARDLPRAAGGGPRARLRRPLRPHVGLLPGVLRGRLPHARASRRPARPRAVNLYPAMDRLTRPLMMRAYKIRILGGERIPANGPCVLASNHECVLDPWFLGTVTPRPVRYLTKEELFRYPVLKQVLGGLGCIPVRRSGDMGRALDAALQALDRGEAIGIFPQGTSLPHRERPFRR